MEFRACCCLKPRTAAVFAGVLDAIIGLIGTLAVGVLLFGMNEGDRLPLHEHSENLTTDGTVTVGNATFPVPKPTTTEAPVNGTGATTENKDAYAEDIAMASYLYAFSALTTLLLGIILLLAAWKKNAGLAKTALVLNLVNIAGCILGTVGLFVLGIHWHTLFPVAIAIIVQIYFFWIVFDYQKYFSYSQPLNVKPRA